MQYCYIYVVARDFGFAPNPFHGCCTLATCKPGIRKHAAVGDWVVGMGGGQLKATGRCIYAMRVDRAMTFTEYWEDKRYRDKRPIRNGSRKMMVGDNIYSFREDTRSWQQADSHHSNPDGTVNTHNLEHDTQADRVLISDHFYYFGTDAPKVPSALLRQIGYKNGRNYRKFKLVEAQPIIEWLTANHSAKLNIVQGDPHDFGASEKRYSVHDNRTV